MGKKSEDNGSSSRLEEVSKDGEVRSKDSEHLVGLINMSLKELCDLSYQQGYYDGLSSVEEGKIAFG